MKIILFIDSIASGGAQRQIVGLAKLLKDKDFDVKVVTYFNIPFYEDYLKENKVTYENINNLTSL